MTTTATLENYTLSDSSLVGEADGTVSLTNLIPSDGTFAATFGSDINGDWGDGALTATIVNGSPSADGGYLKLSGLERIAYPVGNTTNATVGCFRVKVQPQYSGTPGAQQDFCNISNGSNSNNRITMFHATDGNIKVRCYDSSGSQQLEISYAWSPTAGTDYELEFNFDGSTQRLFIDGSVVATDNTSWTRSGAGTERINIGRSAPGADFWVDWIIVFDQVQHTTTYALSDEPTATAYSTATPTATSEGFTGYWTNVTATEVGSPEYVVLVDDIPYYWTGSAWAISDGSQRNSFTVMRRWIDLLKVDNTNPTYKIRAYLVSDGDTATSTNLIVSYREGDAIATTPTACLVQGWLYDSNQNRANVPIMIRTPVSFANEEIFIQTDWQVFSTTEENGYFAGRVYESASVGGAYQFKINNRIYETIIPNQTTVSWDDLALTEL